MSKDDYFRNWSHSLLKRLHEQAGIAFAASMEVIYLRDQLELVTEPDDRPLWRRIATQRRVLHDATKRAERAEKANAALNMRIREMEARFDLD